MDTPNLDQAQANRDRVIIRTSFVGIGVNLLLSAFKAIIGLLSGSIAVVLDAVNNLSDALSSVITIIGTRLASRKPDKKHPLGHGRIEYLSAMIVAAIVLYAGLTSLVESVKKILHPEAADYSVWSLVIIAAAVAAKLLLGRYVKRKGEAVNSGSLIASGSDALFDAILSASVLASAVIFLIFHISLEAWVGALISIFIIKSGVEMLLETLDELLGKRVDRETLAQIRKTICQEPKVLGAYDLILHSYGPEKLIGSVHVEVPDTMDAIEIDELERSIAERVFLQHGVLLTGIGIYAQNTRDEEVLALRSGIYHLIHSHDGVLQTHGFYFDPTTRTVTLDIILDYALDDRQALFDQIVQELRDAYPDCQFRVNMDIDI